MKKIKCYKFLAVIIGIFCFASVPNSYAVSLKEGEPVVRGRTVLSNYLCIENLDLSPEEETVLDNGNKGYKKHVSIEKTYKAFNDEKNTKPKGKIELGITFTYDKKSYVKAETESISSKNCSELWKIRNLPEIFPGEKVYLISDRYSVYNRSTIGVGDYAFDGHIDVFCSSDGKVFVNTELE